MNDRNLITVSNFSEKSNNLAEKKAYSKTGTANSVIFAIFVGATALRSPIAGEVAIGYDHIKSSYIQYINLEPQKGCADLDMNKVVDLMKIENLNKIKKMALFDDDWNGTGGSAFSGGAIDLFKRIIEILVKQPQIAPTGRNSLLMQYELDDKSLLAFEVSERKTEKVYIPKGDYSLAQMEVFTENISQQINESVECFYGFK